MLGYDGLRLVQTSPEIAHAGNFLMCDKAENLQAHGMSDSFELGSIRLEKILSAC